MKAMRGSYIRRPDGSRGTVQTSSPCIHKNKTCDSDCVFFDGETARALTKAVITCSGIPVTVLVRHDDTGIEPRETPVAPEGSEPQT